MKSVLSIFGAALILLVASPAATDEILETATPGTLDGQPPGLFIGETQFIGARFETTEAGTVKVGGRMHALDGVGNEQLFAAVVALDSFTDFPDSVDLSSADVVGVALLSPPLRGINFDDTVSIDTFTLQPGVHALVIGSGLFGATGQGSVKAGDEIIGTPSFLSMFNNAWHVEIPGNPLRLFVKSALDPVIPVSIDIKPGSDPNSINLCSNGAVPVAILGSDTFSVYDILTERLRFAEAAVKVVGRKDPNQLCSYEDVNTDGFDDLVCHYVTTDIAAIDGESTSATVNGELLDGSPFEGTDSVNIVKDTCI